MMRVRVIAMFGDAHAHRVTIQMMVDSNIPSLQFY
jgi:hypothetical protein